MREFTFPDEDLKAIGHNRYHHPHPYVQRKMEVLWLKSHGLPHRQIADLAGVSLRTVQRYLDEYLEGGLTLLRRCKWRGPKTVLLERDLRESLSAVRSGFNDAAHAIEMHYDQATNAYIASTFTSEIATMDRQLAELRDMQRQRSELFHHLVGLLEETNKLIRDLHVENREAV
jgi:transposase